MRYEVKYKIDVLDQESILAVINMHPASFRKIYSDRQVNNIYFDTPQFHCYHQNVEGHQRRQKTRLRWYGDSKSPQRKSILEVKQKDAELGWKDSYPIDVPKDCSRESIMSELKEKGLITSSLIPVLHNTYQRSYYLSQDEKFRVTIDSEQTFKLPFTDMSDLNAVHYPIIIELKYDETHSEDSKSIKDFIPFRQTKNSKYTNGIEQLYF